MVDIPRQARWLAAVLSLAFAGSLGAFLWLTPGAAVSNGSDEVSLNCWNAATNEVAIPLIALLILQPLLYLGPTWRCGQSQRLTMLSSAGLGIALTLILLLQLWTVVVVGLGRTGTTEIAWAWHLHAWGLVAALVFQTMVCAFVARSNMSSAIPSGDQEPREGAEAWIFRAARLLLAGVSFWFAGSAAAYLAWRSRPWSFVLEYGDWDSACSILGDAVLVALAMVFLAFQPLLYLGTSRPRGRVGRIWLRGSACLGVVAAFGLFMVWSIYVNQGDWAHVAFRDLIGNPVLLFEKAIEDPGVIALINLTNMGPWIFVFQIVLGCLAGWLVPRGRVPYFWARER